MSAQSKPMSDGSVALRDFLERVERLRRAEAGGRHAESSAERYRLKRLVNSGPLVGRVVTSVSSGTICPFPPRTKNRPNCFGSRRYSGSACTYTL